MLIQPTLDTLNRLKLHGMAAALSEQLTQSAAMGLAFDERLELGEQPGRALQRLGDGRGQVGRDGDLVGHRRHTCIPEPVAPVELRRVVGVGPPSSRAPCPGTGDDRLHI